MEDNNYNITETIDNEDTLLDLDDTELICIETTEDLVTLITYIQEIIKSTYRDFIQQILSFQENKKVSNDLNNLLKEEKDKMKHTKKETIEKLEAIKEALCLDMFLSELKEEEE